MNYACMHQNHLLVIFIIVMCISYYVVANVNETLTPALECNIIIVILKTVSRAHWTFCAHHQNGHLLGKDVVCLVFVRCQCRISGSQQDALAFVLMTSQVLTLSLLLKSCRLFVEGWWTRSTATRTTTREICICDTGAQNPSFGVFGFFCSVIFYTAYASKYFLPNRNILFLTEVILID